MCKTSLSTGESDCRCLSTSGCSVIPPSYLQLCKPLYRHQNLLELVESFFTSTMPVVDSHALGALRVKDDVVVHIAHVTHNIDSGLVRVANAATSRKTEKPAVLADRIPFLISYEPGSFVFAAGQVAFVPIPPVKQIAAKFEQSRPRTFD